MENYLGAPQTLSGLERQIDEAARSMRWISLDAPALQQMVADGWRPTPPEAADFLRKALTYDDLAVIGGLLDIGIDPNTLEGRTNSPPLYFVRSAGAVRLLVAAGANPNIAAPNTFTPLGHAASLPGEVAQALIQAGAVVDFPTDADGRTALWLASCGGNIDAVKVLLIGGADPTVRAGAKSAIECAREEKQLWGRVPAFLSPPFMMDFDGVIMLLEAAAVTRPGR